jgi:hypothetical protein
MHSRSIFHCAESTQRVELDSMSDDAHAPMKEEMQEERTEREQVACTHQ